MSEFKVAAGNRGPLEKERAHPQLIKHQPKFELTLK